MRLVDAATADRLLDFPSLIEALRDGHRADIDAAGRVLLNAGDDAFLGMAAWQAGAGFGIKLATVFPGNAARGKPNIGSVYVLFDGTDGSCQAVTDATPLTVRKTAADSALAADYLARPDAATLLVVGAGAQARWMVEAFRVVRPSLRRVLIWNRTPDKAAALAAAIGGEAAGNLQSAVDQADIVSCVTASTTPLIRGEWLRPGTHLDLVGGYTPSMREADDTAMRRSRVFVDTRWYTLHDAGDICQPLQSGIIAESDVLGDLFQLVRGAVPGRRSETDITLFKNAGGGHLDLMAARLIASRLHLC